MSKMTNYMMNVEEFCQGYYYPDLGLTDFTIDEVVEDVGAYFKTNMAKEYAKKYLEGEFGENAR